MKELKSTLESFKENELSKMHKLNVYGGLTDGGGDPNDLPLDSELDENGDPKNGTGPRSGGGSTTSNNGAALGNNNPNLGIESLNGVK